MKHGISLVSLMVTIVIMVILASSVTISAFSSINNSRKITFATEISLIQEAIANYYIKNNSLPISEKVEKNILGNEEQFKNEKIQEGIVILYKIDLQKLGNFDLVYGKEKSKDDIYAVSKDTNIVYYVAGISIGENVYYTLTDELKNTIRYTENNINDGIIFTKSENNWTNKNINLEVLVPNTFSDIMINVYQNGENVNTISDFENNGNYNKYIVKQSGNYSVSVKYKVSEQKKEISYNVSNYDDIAPTFKVSDKKILRNEDQEISYITLYDIVENSSDIAKLKYSTSYIAEDEINSYFQVNGISVENNIINFNNDDEYITIYIEDQASNYNYQIIKLK